eukprot:6176587-Pleurochrysis_carterae.AAC.3
MEKRLKVPCLWTVLATLARRRRGLERNSDQVLDELEGGGPVATVEGRRYLTAVELLSAVVGS